VHFDTRTLGFLQRIYVPRLRRLVAWVRQRTISVELRSTVELVYASGLFDADFYARQYPDTAGIGKGPLDHYLRFGLWEDRDPGPLFSCAHYRAQSSHTTQMPAVLHFVLDGDAAGRSPNWLFDTMWYRDRHMRGEEQQRNALFHYLEHHRKRQVWTHPLFDSHWFAARHAQEIPRRTSPLAFYLGSEGASRLMPNPLFDPEWYVQCYAIESDQPLRHYIEYGDHQGLAPHPLLCGRRLSILAPDR